MINLKEFGAEFGLSARELDILSHLCGEVLTVKAIAEKMGTSPSTIRNQLNAIFEKTSTNSKVGLLAKYLARIEKKIRIFQDHRRPIVFIVDDEKEIVDLTAEHLEDRGCKVYRFYQAAGLLEAMKDIFPDVVISDIRMPNMDGVLLLNAIRTIHHYEPGVILVTGHAGEYQIDDLLDMGSIAVLEKPVDYEKLLGLITEHFLTANLEKNRYIRANTSMTVNVGEEKGIVLENVGYGGAFLKAADEAGQNWVRSLNEGVNVELTFKLPNDEQEITCEAEIVWRRLRSLQEKQAGVGVKFKNITQKDRDKIFEYVRHQRIIGFIPKSAKANLDK